jgi:cell wall-associated NlpC family hydrolase
MKSIIKNLQHTYEEKYGFSLFDVESQRDNDKLILYGEVLLASQAKELERRIREECSGELVNNIIVIADLDSHAEIGWAIAPTVPLNVYRYPPFIRKKNALSTQIYDAEEWFRVFYKKEDFCLIQLIDFTLGWISEENIHLVQQDKRMKWEVSRAAKNKTLEVSDDRKHQLKSRAEDFLGVPYRWGGTTEKGIDCSGFTQRLYREVLDVYLPKNSRDQRKLGKRVSRSDISFGDLLFLKAKRRNLSHVALYFDDDTVIHASLHQQKVVKESLKTVLESHRFVGIRRIFS